MSWFIKNYILRKWYNFRHIGPDKMEMVSYWKTSDHAAAKLTQLEDGSMIMDVENEKYPITCFPRSFLLFGPLSKLKHEIKNQIFNNVWRRVEVGESSEQIMEHLRRDVFPEILKLLENMKYDLVPPETMYGATREIYRAWTKVGGAPEWRDILCLIMGEDDSYQFRIKFLAERFHRYRWFIRDPIKRLKKAFETIGHAETINDMKERERLWARGFITLLEDPKIRKTFDAFCKEVDWKKLYMTKGDLYHVRAKYFRPDYEVFKDQW